MVTHSLESLRAAIRETHGCSSRWSTSAIVTDKRSGATIEVEVFDLIDHDTASVAYVWPDGTDNGHTRYIATLHRDSVDSPEAAVSATFDSSRRVTRI